MKVTNLSTEPLGKLLSWLPHSLQADEIVFLPDACPGKSPLPTGTAVLTRQSDWRRFALSDCGCGMRLLRSSMPIGELSAAKWNKLANSLRANKGKLGDLGSGNHFVDALAPSADGPLYFLVHTGSRYKASAVDALTEDPNAFDRKFSEVVCWAAENRATVQSAIENIFGRTGLILDLPHNTYEQRSDEAVIIRKGSVRIYPGQQSILPSHMLGDVALIRGADRVGELLNSVSHGTGRTMSRSDSKVAANVFNFDELRASILLPDGVDISELRTEGPFAYRELDQCLELLKEFVEVEQRFRVIGYLGHLG